MTKDPRTCPACIGTNDNHESGCYLAPPSSNLRVKLLKDVYDDGQDHHPPGYIARKGDVVVIHSIQTAVVSHHGTGHGFVVHDGELELMRQDETTAHRPAVFRHKKTGNLYERLHEALESTNGALEGLPMVVYRRMDTQGVYVREAEEFAEKFERVTDSSSVEPTRDDPNAPFRWICPKCTTVNAFEDKVCVSCRHELHHYHVSCQCPDCNARHIGFRMRAEKASGIPGGFWCARCLTSYPGMDRCPKCDR